MPYSPTLGIVFVAIPKTGTTSITRALHTIEPTGNSLQLLNEHIDDNYRRRFQLDQLGDSRPGKGKHLSAIQIRNVLGTNEFDRCLKFTVVRNPWARVVSRYSFNHIDIAPGTDELKERGSTRNLHDLGFDQWMERRWQRHKSGKKYGSQLGKITDFDRNLLVDHVGRLEKVQETLDWICAQVGTAPLKMPHVNGTGQGHYSQFYNRRTREMVAEMCREDIEYFDYCFENQSDLPLHG